MKTFTRIRVHKGCHSDPVVFKKTERENRGQYDFNFFQSRNFLKSCF